MNRDADPDQDDIGEDESEIWLDIDGSLGQRDHDTTFKSSCPRSKTPDEWQAILNLVRVCFCGLLQCLMTLSSPESDLHHQYNDAKHKPEM